MDSTKIMISGYERLNALTDEAIFRRTAPAEPYQSYIRVAQRGEWYSVILYAQFRRYTQSRAFSCKNCEDIPALLKPYTR